MLTHIEVKERVSLQLDDSYLSCIDFNEQVRDNKSLLCVALSPHLVFSLRLLSSPRCRRLQYRTGRNPTLSIDLRTCRYEPKYLRWSPAA